ncbi:MAG TPA: hypothetical protein PLS21_04180 [Synergistales bacterium]|nr:hypothetical protein [Synergistales bacterium]HQO83175.1 hypothetical protein [Synergistales bacterium]HQQ10439.1 hypothetical protein [Synergistales bacterium]
MKKKAVLLALVAVFALGSLAYAHGGGFDAFGPGMGPDCYGRHRMSQSGGPYSDRNVQKIEYPQEILDQMEELRRTHLEMRLELSQDEPDVEKARLLFKKAQGIRSEISNWRFESYIESLKKQ